MKVRLDAARLLLYRAVVHAEKGTPSELESSIAKLCAMIRLNMSPGRPSRSMVAMVSRLNFHWVTFIQGAGVG